MAAGDVRPSESPLIEKIWYTQSEHPSEFVSSAASHSEIVIAKCARTITITVRGPETRASTALIPPDGEFLGIVFALGTFMPDLLPRNLTDLRDAFLPVVSDRTFRLDSSLWEIPTFENADTFVERLVRSGLLVHDPVVDAVLHNQPHGLSPRAVQYRFLQATGVTHKTIQQIERAHQASALLEQGVSILDTVYEAGYFDQSHLTNALKRYIGITPAQIVRKPK